MIAMNNQQGLAKSIQLLNNRGHPMLKDGDIPGAYEQIRFLRFLPQLFQRSFGTMHINKRKYSHTLGSHAAVYKNFP